MSKLFELAKIGKLEIKNRFIHSATYEGMAKENGQITDEILKRYGNLAKGEVGLIIPGYMYVLPAGKAFKYQTGIHSDHMIPGLKALVDTVHESGGTIFFQLAHAGRQTTKNVAGEVPIGPSAKGRDPLYFVKPKEMDEQDIQVTIEAFGSAAKRAVKAGVDGIQIHAAHGYLVNKFLSPFFNSRDDKWGGSDENRFRFLKQIVLKIRNVVDGNLPVIAKLSTHDHTPKQGITLSLAAKYAKLLAESGIDERGESVFVDTDSPRMPMFSPVCPACGLIQQDQRDLCVYCGSALNRGSERTENQHCYPYGAAQHCRYRQNIPCGLPRGGFNS